MLYSLFTAVGEVGYLPVRIKILNKAIIVSNLISLKESWLMLEISFGERELYKHGKKTSHSKRITMKLTFFIFVYCQKRVELFKTHSQIFQDTNASSWRASASSITRFGTMWLFLIPKVGIAGTRNVFSGEYSNPISYARENSN